MQLIAQTKVLSNNIMNTLPIEGKVWSKARAQKYNRFIAETMHHIDDENKFKQNGGEMII